MFARFLRQPLLHFCVIGASFFALFSVFGNEPADPRPKGQIIISPQDAHWLAQQFESTWRRPPTAQELNSLIDGFIEEEVYVREALMLGLDQGDTVVRNRLRQKMEFLTEAGAQAANPDEETLRQHYHENAARFTAPARISFMQMLLPEGRDAADVLTQLKAGRDPAQLSASTLLPTQITRSSQQAIDGTFGPGMFEALQSVDLGIWAGPVPSGYGQHLVHVTAHQPQAVFAFEAVRDQVELDWRANMAEELRARRYEQLFGQYQITRPDASEVLGQ